MTQREIQYKKDQKVERLCSEYIDKFFYSKLDGIKFQRYSDEKYQFQGIDLELNSRLVDEKVKYQNSWNSIVQNIGFELSFINNANEIQKGWFINEKLKTTHYCIISPFTNVSNEKFFNNISQIEKIDLLFIAKNYIKKYIERIISLDEIIKDSKNLKFYPVSSDGKIRKRYPFIRDFWLVLSNQKFEKPINLVIRRNILENLKHSRHFLVNKHEIREIKD